MDKQNREKESHRDNGVIWHARDYFHDNEDQEADDTGNHEDRDIAVGDFGPRVFSSDSTPQNPENLNSVAEHHCGADDQKNSDQNEENHLVLKGKGESPTEEEENNNKSLTAAVAKA